MPDVSEFCKSSIDFEAEKDIPLRVRRPGPRALSDLTVFRRTVVQSLGTNEGSERMNPEYARLLDLGVSEKLELVEVLWDSIAASPEELPVPSWQKDELAKRKASHLRNPDSAASWDEAKERIRQRHG